MKIGRNDLCPCGSGKKYKQCCMLNQNKDTYSLIREVVLDDGYKDELADVLCNMVRYIKEKQWMGACHASTSVLYVILSELGYETELFVGEVQKPGLPPFDHSWITVDGKIIDIAVIMTLMGGAKISDAVVLDKDIVTKTKYDLKYGICSGVGLDAETKLVMQLPFVDYMDAFPAEVDGLWGVIDKISPVKLDKVELKKKYIDTKRTFVNNN